MAVTGLLLVAFLLAHMLGNLKIFFGQTSFDHYAHWIRTIGSPALPHTWFLWIQRTGLTVALFAHVGSAYVLARRARRARPVRYAHRPPVQGSYAARTMRWGGVIVLLFLVYHLLDLSAGTANPRGEAGHPYANVVEDFRPGHWYIALAYAVSIIAVGFHLRHGIYSAMRTLGQRTARGERWTKRFALGFSVFLCAGFLSVPFFVLVGVVS
jgi:succinate dehydrogenase / fumarate reductase cytochrome b subunit